MSVTIDYTLNVSPSAKDRRAQKSNNNGTEGNLSFNVVCSPGGKDGMSETSESYYGHLSTAIKAAIAEVGNRLTEWRDAVGDEEKAKERAVASIAKARKAAEDESEDDGGTA